MCIIPITLQYYKDSAISTSRGTIGHTAKMTMVYFMDTFIHVFCSVRHVGLCKVLRLRCYINKIQIKAAKINLFI